MLGPEGKSELWPASKIASQILGGGPNARLALDVHQPPSFAHASSASLVEVAHGPAPMVIAATVPRAKAGPALAAMLERLRTMVAAAPTATELEASARELAGAELFGLETSRETADLASRWYMLGLGDGYHDEYLQQLERARAADVHGAATEYMSQVRAAVVVGDAELLVAPSAISDRSTCSIPRTIFGWYAA